jgi:hypothetical protein
MRKFLLLTALILAVLVVHLLHAQTPAPVILQPTNSSAVAHPTPAPQTPAVSDDTMQLLQEMQATNAETLKKQAATLQALDDLQKAAAQIRIYTKRS